MTPSPFTSGSARSKLSRSRAGLIGENVSPYVPVTYERCEHIRGPFYHGTRSVLEAGDELVPGHASNFQEGRVSNNIYFTTLVDTAAWGAELATALAGCGEPFGSHTVDVDAAPGARHPPTSRAQRPSRGPPNGRTGPPPDGPQPPPRAPYTAGRQPSPSATPRPSTSHPATPPGHARLTRQKHPHHTATQMTKGLRRSGDCNPRRDSFTFHPSRANHAG